MNPCNEQEYLQLKRELDSIRDCMTKYIGWTLGGSVAAFLGIAAAARESENRWMLGLGALVAVVVISFVEVILLYKFTSHNRYTGFCKLLSQESFAYDSKKAPLFSWETCIDRIRASDDDPDDYAELCDGITSVSLVNWKKTLTRNGAYVKAKVEELSGRHPSIDPGYVAGGLAGLASMAEIVFPATAGFVLRVALKQDQQKRRSWRYPPYITGTLLLLSMLFTAVGSCLIVLGVMQEVGSGIPSYIGYLGVTGVAILLCGFIVVLSLLWWKFLAKLSAVMYGSMTVDANCWRFLPIRYHVVKATVGFSEYRLILGSPSD